MAKILNKLYFYIILKIRECFNNSSTKSENVFNNSSTKSENVLIILQQNQICRFDFTDIKSNI